MITKTAENILSKEAGFWKGLWNLRKWSTVKDAGPEFYEFGKNLASKMPKVIGKVGRGVVNTADKAGRFAGWYADKAIKNPYVVIPSTLSGAYALNSAVHKVNAFEAHIQDPNSGVTRVSPITGNINFTRPEYEAYYR